MAADSDPRQELRALAGRLRTNLALRARSGLAGVPAGRSRRRGGPGAEAREAVPVEHGAPAAPPVVPGRGAQDDGPTSSRPTGLGGLRLTRDELGDCQRCKLAKGRTNLVFGVGNPEAHLVFVGEGPGADEDAQGEPFVGKAGQLLNKMIEAMGYRREDVYICNVVKCRPPGNRNPEPDEIEACEPFLKKQLAALRPRVIVTLGKFAAQCLLRDDTPISRLRGNFRIYEGVQLMPTFHPAYLLRDPSKKKETWEDLKAVMAALRRMGLGPADPASVTLTGLAPLPIVDSVRRATRTAIQVAMVAALVVAGCSQKKRTEIIVGLATDLDAPAPLASVSLQAFVQGDFPIGAAEIRNISGDPAHPFTIPGTYGVYSEAGTADRVRVKLIAADAGGNVLVVRSAVFNLVPEKTLFVRLGLVSACMNRTDCDEANDQTCVDGRCDQTCVDGRCVPNAIDSSTLPEYHAGDETQLSCASTVNFIDTSTKQPLMTSGTPCASGMCSEGVCLLPPAGGVGGAGGSPATGGQSGQGGAGGAGGSPAGGHGGGAAGAAGGAGPPPQLTSLVPASGTAGTAVTLNVRGQGIGDGWVIYFNGNQVSTTISQDSDGVFASVTINIMSTFTTGQIPVWLQKGTLVSNTLYFTVTPAPGAPTIVDYTPDNAMPGATISIVGTNLISEPVTITDPLGRPMPVVAMGTTTWVGAKVDRVDVTVPSDMVTGPLTAANTQGSFQGRVFNVGQNLSLLPGVVATSSTQFNTTNWSRMSGYDNNLQTSFFTMHGDCVGSTSCTTVPYYQLTWAAPLTVSRIAMRGNREYASGYDFVEGRFDILDAGGAVLWSQDRLLPDPDRDLDVLVSPAVANASSVRFTSVMDQPDEPGFSELEVF